MVEKFRNGLSERDLLRALGPDHYLKELTHPPMLKPTMLVFDFLAYMPVVLLTTFIPALSMTLPRLVVGID